MLRPATRLRGPPLPHPEPPCPLHTSLCPPHPPLLQPCRHGTPATPTPVRPRGPLYPVAPSASTSRYKDCCKNRRRDAKWTPTFCTKMQPVHRQCPYTLAKIGTSCQCRKSTDTTRMRRSNP